MSQKDKFVFIDLMTTLLVRVLSDKCRTWQQQQQQKTKKSSRYNLNSNMLQVLNSKINQIFYQKNERTADFPKVKKLHFRFFFIV
jgi:adenosyl cobinamide kinase/adenosyl cobinamide phosphate guanylyltransferase